LFVPMDCVVGWSRSAGCAAIVDRFLLSRLGLS
jgi:hypothetical protein